MLSFEDWLYSISLEISKRLNIGAGTLIAFMNDDPDLSLEVLNWDLGADAKVSLMNRAQWIEYLNDIIDEYKSRYDEYVERLSKLN